MLKEINLHPKCQTRYWKKMECQRQHDFSYIKAPWVRWQLMYSKHQDGFLETSCPWLQPSRQSSHRDRLIPKLSPRHSWSRVQTWRRTHMGKGSVQGKKNEIILGVRGGKRTVAAGPGTAVDKKKQKKTIGTDENTRMPALSRTAT